jgi:SagB-type dehydrogenase family enzyme
VTVARNDEIQATWLYHDGTKHSFESLRASRHTLDWPNQPIPYKIYTSLDPIPLPRDFPPSPVPALDAITRPVPAPSGEQVPDLATLARLCFFSNGITKHLRYAGGEKAFRAAACTGALYHVELYLVCGDLPDLAAGVYHYAADDHALRRLRAGDFRQVLVDATGAEPAVATAPVVVACTSTFWRNSWKYQARAYRHTYWDSGVILANLLAEASAVDLAARLVLGFADAAVNHLLDVDPDREAAVSLVALGHTDRPIPPAPAVEPLAFPTAPLSPREVDYPAIRAMHAASSLDTDAQAAAWRGALPPESPPPPAGPLVPLAPLPPSELPTDPLETVIRRRGSSRRFTQEPIGFGQLSTMLQCATAPIHADCMPPDQPPPTDLYLIVNAVEGLAPGTYALRRDRRALEQLEAGDCRYEAGALDLGQELAADAAVNVYFLGDLQPLLARYGNRGYRLAQLAGAIGGGRLYLAAYALRIGATGLTFFDDAVTQFFSPHAAGKSVMFLVALGHPLRRAR